MAFHGKHTPEAILKIKIAASLPRARISPEGRRNMSLAHMGHQCSPETRRKISDSNKGAKSYRWISDRTKLVRKQQRNDYAYKNWRMGVWVRDGFHCRMSDQDCEGRIEAHHILGWKDFPELRYETNNGITLCHAHHPLRRAEEKRLIPWFQGLVSVSNRE